jgi:hypothetical protein
MNFTRIAKGGIRIFGSGCSVRAAGPALLAVVAMSSIHAADCNRIRWDLQHVDFSTSPVTLSPGGTAFASADANNQITFTDSSGTFVARSSARTLETSVEAENGCRFRGVTGGGKWQSFDGMNTKSGTYRVTQLVSWQFANLQVGAPIDLIDAEHPRANGTAILRIEYDDGSEGILGIGCHGVGAPPGIQEGVIATKGYVTYWTGAFHPPVASLIDVNFTLFHILE